MFWVAAILLSAVPLLWPAIPPLTDLPGHMGRYHVALAIDHSAALQRYFSFQWALIGNLGVDLAVLPLAHLIGLEPATKIVVLLIPVLTATGMLWAAREAHGRLPPTAAFALPLAYAWPFQFGFVNFALAQALALNGFALWIRLGRQRRLALRSALFMPIACGLWLAHDFGWGLFGLIAYGAETARRREAGATWLHAFAGAIPPCLPLALPVLAMVLHPAQSVRGSMSGDWFDLPLKFIWLISAFRDRWQILDATSITAALVLLYFSARGRWLTFEPVLAIPALLCAVAFLLLPRVLLGGAYVDMRMAPVMLMLGLLAICTREGDGEQAGNRRLAEGIAFAALLFFTVRTVATTASFAILDARYQRELAAIAMIPEGAPILVLADTPCHAQWSTDRLDHLAAMAIVRRNAFVNDQWDLEGQQLLRVHYRIAAPFVADPSQLIYPPRCAETDMRFDPAIARFNRQAFDYVWTLGFPPGRAHAPDLVPVWNNGTSALYRVVRSPAR